MFVTMLAAEANPLNVELWTIVWTVVWFVVLLAVLGRFAWKPLLAAMEGRENGIRDSLDRAEKAREEAEGLLAEHKRKIEAAEGEVRGIIEEGRQQAESMKAKILEEARTSAQDTVDRATREIDLAKEDALRSIREEAVDLTVSLASKVVERSLAPKDHEELIRKSMKELEL